MKIVILPENLSTYAPLINKILPSHSQIPILSNVLLEATKEGFYVKTTDLEIGAQIKIAAKIEVEGAVTVPGREFIEIITSLPKDKVSISLDKDIVTVSCRNNNIQLNTISGSEFPQLFREKGVEVERFTRKEFVEIFSCLIFSVSLEDSRPQLGGVFMDNKEGSVNFVSTDGYRMSVKTHSQNNKNKENMIVSTSLINEVMSLKGEEDVVLYVNKNESQVIFEVGDAIIVGRMIEGIFPDYEKVMPKTSTTSVVFNREDLLQHVKLASVFARESSNIAALEVLSGKLKITSRTQGVGEGEMVIDCQTQGEPNKISFNIKYLMDVLRNVSGEEMVLGLTSASEPAVFSTPNKEFVHVIMPIQVD